MMTAEEAIRYMRSREEYATLIHASYTDADTEQAASRFAESAEFQEVRELLRERLRDGCVLDLGAGNGIASVAFARAGARIVYALEPDPSVELGRGAVERIRQQLPIQVIDSPGEKIPLDDGTVDVVYARQVLHHIRDLPAALRECARVLKKGGCFLACREHVVDDSTQLAAFLAAHPTHQLTGGENAYSLAEYQDAIRGAGMRIERLIGPWDSIINAYPRVTSTAELQDLPSEILGRRFGKLGHLAARFRPVRALAWSRLNRPFPGRLYTFFARKA